MRITHIATTTVALAALLSPLLAPANAARQEIHASPVQISDAYVALGKEYSAAVRQWRADCKDAAKISKEKEQELKAAHPAKAYWPRFEQQLDGGEGRALLWMVEACEETEASKSVIVAKKDALIARLIKDFAGASWAAADIVRLVPRQRVWFDEAWVRAHLRELADASKNKEVVSAALYELAQRLSTPKASDDEKTEAARLLAKITAEYAGTKAAEKLHEKATAFEFEVGGKPDFDAVDPDDVAFKLSDYRGKVVMLDFWGFW